MPWANNSYSYLDANICRMSWMFVIKIMGSRQRKRRTQVSGQAVAFPYQIFSRGRKLQFHWLTVDFQQLEAIVTYSTGIPNNNINCGVFLWCGHPIAQKRNFCTHSLLEVLSTSCSYEFVCYATCSIGRNTRRTEEAALCIHFLLWEPT